MGRCESAAVASLAEQALCLSHFLRHCYDQLDRLDARGRKRAFDKQELRDMRETLDAFSGQTLRVCLSGTPLDNLERGRLLDILLWAGELYILLRIPRSGGRSAPLLDWRMAAHVLQRKTAQQPDGNGI